MEKNELTGGEDTETLANGTERDQIVDAVRKILVLLGEDVDREGLRKTPERFTDALISLTKGYRAELKAEINDALFANDEVSDQMVMVRDIDVASLCEHHMLPFFGKLHIIYIPHHCVLGISKFARIAQAFSQRFQIQERLGEQIADAINQIVYPKALAVILECEHTCMSIRGVQQSRATTVTQCLRGSSGVDLNRLEELCLIVNNRRP